MSERYFEVTYSELKSDLESSASCEPGTRARVPDREARVLGWIPKLKSLSSQGSMASISASGICIGRD